MTRRTDELLTLWHADEDDVCSAEDLLSRVARSAPIARRRRAALAIVAATMVIAGVVATFVALRSDHRPAPQAGVAVSSDRAITTHHVIASTLPASPTPTSTSTHVIVLGDAHIRVPTRWSAAPYLGQIATVYFPIIFLGTDPFTGPCGSTAKANYKCTSQNWFPPGSTTPGDGVLIKWGHSVFPGSPDRLTFAPGRKLTIDHRPAKLYAGAPIDTECPPGVHTQIAASVRTSTSRYSGGDLYDTVACLGAHVSAADRDAVYAMIYSLRITG